MRSSPVFGRISLLLVLWLLLTAGSCRSECLELATPEGACKASLASWKGLVPGQSTKEDVERVSGQPIKKVNLRESNRFYYLYPPVIARLETSYGNKVVFRQDGVVDWIDVWVSNTDGKFHTVAEIAQKYGCVLDRVYLMEDLPEYSVVGPAQVYVWADCGIAITAVPGSFVGLSADEVPPRAESAGAESCTWTVRHPVHSQATLQPRPSVEDIVIRKFMFQPTSFASFQEFYVDWIPFLSTRFYRLE